MNISAQHFGTKIRTWLLIAGLTALLIGIGVLIGGAFHPPIAERVRRLRALDGDQTLSPGRVPDEPDLLNPRHETGGRR